MLRIEVSNFILKTPPNFTFFFFGKKFRILRARKIEIWQEYPRIFELKWREARKFGAGAPGSKASRTNLFLKRRQ